MKPIILPVKHSGIVLDLPPEEAPAEAWTGGYNVQFQDGSSRRVGGYAPYAGQPLGVPVFALNITLDAVNYWLYCGDQNVWVTDGTDHWDITPTAGLTFTLPWEWSGTVLNGVAVLNNTHEPPMYWDFSTALGGMKPLPGWPVGATCRVIRAFKYHLFALGIFDGELLESTLWWSSAAEPGAVPPSWTPAAENDAGDMTLGDTPGIIVDGQALRDAFIVYKGRACYVLSYVAGQYVYTGRKLFLTAGAIGPSCVTEYNGNHYVITGDDVIKHDGQSFVSLVETKVKQYLVSMIDPGRKALCCVVARHANNQIWVCIPTAGSDWLNLAFLISTLTGDVGVRQLPNCAYVARGLVFAAADESDAWDTDLQAWDMDPSYWDQQAYGPTEDSLLMCSVTEPGASAAPAGSLQHVDKEDTNNGAPVTALLERTGIMFSESNERRFFISRLMPRIDGEPGEIISIQVGGQDYFDGPVHWADAYDFVIGSDVYVPAQVEGRMAAVRFQATTERRWRLHAYRFEIVAMGKF